MSLLKKQDSTGESPTVDQLKAQRERLRHELELESMAQARLKHGFYSKHKLERLEPAGGRGTGPSAGGTVLDAARGEREPEGGPGGAAGQERSGAFLRTPGCLVERLTQLLVKVQELRARQAQLEILAQQNQGISGYPAENKRQAPFSLRRLAQFR